MKGRVLITGATGVIGPVLARTLKAEGFAVRAFARKAPPEGLLPEGTEIALGDLGDRASIDAAVQGVDFVCHLAARLHTNNPGRELEAEYERVNVEGTRLLAEFSRAAGAKGLVFFSSILVYGSTKAGEILTEQSPLKPESLYARNKADGERIVREILPESTVLRLAAVYGPGMKGNYLTMLRAIGRGRFALIGDGSNRRTLIHVEDLGRAVALALQSEKARGQVYNVTDGRLHTVAEISDSMRSALGRRGRIRRVPLKPAWALAKGIDAGVKALRLPLPSISHLILKLNEDIAVDGTKIRNELGFRVERDMTQAWRQVAESRNT